VCCCFKNLGEILFVSVMKSCFLVLFLFVVFLCDTMQPLSVQRESKWQQYFENDKIFKEIDKDVRRTVPDIDFFITDHHDQVCTPV
jgi:hypothetical protein